MLPSYPCHLEIRDLPFLPHPSFTSSLLPFTHSILPSLPPSLHSLTPSLPSFLPFLTSSLPPSFPPFLLHCRASTQHTAPPHNTFLHLHSTSLCQLILLLTVSFSSFSRISVSTSYLFVCLFFSVCLSVCLSICVCV